MKWLARILFVLTLALLAPANTHALTARSFDDGFAGKTDLLPLTEKVELTVFAVVYVDEAGVLNGIVCLNDPVNNIDVHGLAPKSAHGTLSFRLDGIDGGTLTDVPDVDGRFVDHNALTDFSAPSLAGSGPIPALINTTMVSPIPNFPVYTPYYVGEDGFHQHIAAILNNVALAQNGMYAGLDTLGWVGERIEDGTIYLTGMGSAELYMTARSAGPLATIPGAIPYALTRFGTWLRSLVPAADEFYILNGRLVPAANAGAVGSLGQKIQVAGGGPNVFENLAIQATRNPGSSKLVLGKYLEDGTGYTKVAAHYEASYFKLDNWQELTRGLAQDEIWKINEAFLVQQIKLGKQIILSHDPAKASRFFLREVQFLERLGYRFVQDGWVWKAIK